MAKRAAYFTDLDKIYGLGYGVMSVGREGWIPSISQEIPIELPCDQIQTLSYLAQAQQLYEVSRFIMQCTLLKCIAQIGFTIHPGIVDRTRPFCLYIRDHVGSITYLVMLKKKSRLSNIMERLEIANIGCVYLPEHLYCDSLSSPVHIISLIYRWGRYGHLCAINAPNYIWKS